MTDLPDAGAAKIGETNPAFSKGAKPLGATLVGIVGAIAALGLFTAVPREESGRTVQATVQADGGIALHQVARKRYLVAYQDDVGVWTACDGIAYVKPGATFTPGQCDALLEAQLVKHAEGVMACTPGLKPPGHDRQRIAAVLLAYNIGVGAYCATARPPCTATRKANCSTSGIVRKFNAGQYRAACDAFLAFSKAGGRPILLPRRKRERALCLQDAG